MKNKVMIDNIMAREVLDSRGVPTIEVEVITQQGIVGKAIVGAEVLNNCAVELRDNDKKRYDGVGMLNAVHNVNEVLNTELKGMNVLEQLKIDNYMNYLDGTKNKASLGVNAILGVSMAVARAAANTLKQPLYTYIGGISGNTIPTPIMNVINGGINTENNLTVNHFMIIPRNTSHFSDKIRMCLEVYRALREIFQKDGIKTGESSGIFPNLRSDLECLDYLMRAFEKTGYIDNFAIGIDMAASELFNSGKYYFRKRNQEFKADELIEKYQEICEKYPIILIEDGLAKNNFDGWKKLTNVLGERVHLAGSELFTTSVEKLAEGIKSRTANSIIIKLNQMGTVTETIETIKMAKAYGYMPIMSQVTGETEDPFIADFAVALNMKYIKCGAPSGSENMSKYNQLLRIEDNLLNGINE